MRQEPGWKQTSKEGGPVKNMAIPPLLMPWQYIVISAGFTFDANRSFMISKITII
jgi:hypothetical protein